MNKATQSPHVHLVMLLLVVFMLPACTTTKPVPLDHFLCYDARPQTVLEDSVGLRDQFDTDRRIPRYEVTGPISFCNPVEKFREREETPIENPDHHLTAYKLVGSFADRRPPAVFITNQFTEREQRIQPNW